MCVVSKRHVALSVCNFKVKSQYVLFFFTHSTNRFQGVKKKKEVRPNRPGRGTTSFSVCSFTEPQEGGGGKTVVGEKNPQRERVKLYVYIIQPSVRWRLKFVHQWKWQRLVVSCSYCWWVEIQTVLYCPRGAKCTLCCLQRIDAVVQFGERNTFTTKLQILTFSQDSNCI